MMKHLYRYVAALAIIAPVVASAQGNSNKLEIVDHWMTQATLTSALGLSEADWDRVKDAYAAVNSVLDAGTKKKGEHKEKFKNKKPTKNMTEAERNEQKAELQGIRADYDVRQATLTEKLNALRALLSSSQQTLFDALEKPRLAPTTPMPVEVIPPTPGRKPRPVVPPPPPPPPM